MRFRTVEMHYELALDDTGTKPIEIKTRDPLSAIRLEFKGSNGSSYNKSNRMDDIITKIELVDGSDVLWALNCKNGQAQQFFNTKQTPFIRIEERGGGSTRQELLMQFGPKLYDLDYWLDLTKFTSPSLKITTDEDAVRAIAADGFATGSFKVTVTLHVIEEGANPSKGFLMCKEIYSFTSATSGDEHVPIPMDYPIAGILLRAYVAGNDINENISALKLSCDAGKYIPIDKKVGDICTMNETDYGICEIRAQLDRKNGETVLHCINKEPVAMLLGDEATLVMQAMYQWSGQFNLSVYDNAGAAVTAERWIRTIIQGTCLHSATYVALGQLDQVETYFDPKEWNDVELILTQAAASVVEVCLQQLRTYVA